MKNNGVFRTVRIIAIIAGFVIVLCGTVWAISEKFADHDKRITTLETHVIYIREAVERIEKKVNE